MATNAPVTRELLRRAVLRVLAAPRARARRSRPARSAATTYGVTSSMLSVSRARSSMIAEARNSGRRWTMSTLPANFDRKVASSMAVSPPPTTIVVGAAEEGRVAGGAVGDAARRQLVLARHAELLRLGAHREDHRARPDLLAADVHDVRAAVLGGEVDAGRVVRDEAGAEALGLVAEVLHHLRAHHALRVARVVLDVGRLLEQAAPGEALDHERVEVRARRVERGGVARGAAADDDDVLDVLVSSLITLLSEVYSP